MTLRNATAVIILSASLAPVAAAGLLGDTVEIWGRAQLNGSSTLRDTVVVSDPGVEYTAVIVDPIYSLDLTDGAIRLDSLGGWFSPWFNSGFEPSAIELRDLDFVGDPSMVIGGVSVAFGGVIEPEDDAPLGYPAFSAANVEFGSDWVRIVTGPYRFEEGAFVQIDLQFVPAPGPAALAGLAGLAAARRRR